MLSSRSIFMHLTVRFHCFSAAVMLILQRLGETQPLLTLEAFCYSELFTLLFSRFYFATLASTLYVFKIFRKGLNYV